MSDFRKKIFIVAGESSGDMHAASLIREIKRIRPDTVFSGIGGNEMKNEKTELLYELKDVNYIGFSSVIKNIGKIKSIFDNCVNSIKKINPDAVVLVDYPGFNLKLIKSLSDFYKGKIVYYISPQLWAWHKSRIKIIKERVDLMIVVFPFEVDFYKKEDIRAEFAGHPLVKRIDNFLKHNSPEKNQRKVISILPGSRNDEIERMLPGLLNAADLFKKEFDCTVNVLCSPNFSEEYFLKFIKKRDVRIIHDKTNSNLNYKAILNSDFVITKSGTSTVECALIGTPFCVVYKTGPVNYEIGKRLIRVNNIAMVNILLGKEAVKEFVQKEMTPENIFREGKRILSDEAYCEEMKTNFRELRNILTGKDASENAALLISNLIG